MRYAKAVTDEREKYWRERKAICEGRITARSADGTLMDPTQAFEDAQARYVDACAPIIVQAYHDGNYDDTFEATSLMQVKTRLFGGSIEPRNMRIRDRNASGTNVRDIYTDIIKVEELIDYAASRMSVS